MEKKNFYRFLKVVCYVGIVAVILGAFVLASYISKKQEKDDDSKKAIDSIAQGIESEKILSDEGDNTYENFYNYELNKLQESDANTVYMGSDNVKVVLNKTTVADVLAASNFEIEYKYSSYEYEDVLGYGYSLPSQQPVTEDDMERFRSRGLTTYGRLTLSIYEPGQKDSVIIYAHSLDDVDLYELDFSRCYIYGVRFNYSLKDTKYAFSYRDINQFSTFTDIETFLGPNNYNFEFDDLYQTDEDDFISNSRSYQSKNIYIDYYDYTTKDEAIEYSARELYIREDRLECTTSLEEFNARKCDVDF